MVGRFHVPHMKNTQIKVTWGPKEVHQRILSFEIFPYWKLHNVLSMNVHLMISFVAIPTWKVSCTCFLLSNTKPDGNFSAVGIAWLHQFGCWIWRLNYAGFSGPTWSWWKFSLETSPNSKASQNGSLSNACQSFRHHMLSINRRHHYFTELDSITLRCVYCLICQY